MEVFKDIKEYEGMYQISNLGRVKSKERLINDGRTEGYRKRKEIIIGIKTNNKYHSVSLSKNGIKKPYLVHRLVAETFIENKEQKLEVNHINGIKSDNRVENLEWVTRIENSIHSWNNGLSKPYWTGKQRSDETILKISATKKGKPSNRKGVKLTQETKDRISNSLKGNIPWNKKINHE